MEKIKILIVGYGNVGKGVEYAVQNNPDMELLGIVTRRDASKLNPRSGAAVFDFKNVSNLKNVVDVAILCGGSKEDLPNQGPQMIKLFHTVDSFDTHANIPEYFAQMDKLGKENCHVAVISTGWDPGTFSLERTLADAFMPGAKHYTFWGPGVSQGHSDAARKVEGVLDARSYTLPVGKAMDSVRGGQNPQLSAREKHERRVYVVAKDGADQKAIANTIKTMPNYFSDYNTEVIFISEEQMKKEHSEYPHGGFVMASGKTGAGNKAMIEYKCQWDSNPEATGNILVAHARAAYRLDHFDPANRRAGAFTILDIPPAYFSPRSGEELRKSFM